MVPLVNFFELFSPVLRRLSGFLKDLGEQIDQVVGKSGPVDAGVGRYDH